MDFLVYLRLYKSVPLNIQLSIRNLHKMFVVAVVDVIATVKLYNKCVIILLKISISTLIHTHTQLPDNSYRNPIYAIGIMTQLIS